VHGQEFNSCRRKTRWKALCDTLHIREWVEGDHAPVCVGGRSAAPPEFFGGPIGYRLMLKRQREGAAMSDPVRLEAGVQMLAETWGVTPSMSRKGNHYDNALAESFVAPENRMLRRLDSAN
jgi:hypothetical protein